MKLRGLRSFDRASTPARLIRSVSIPIGFAVLLMCASFIAPAPLGQQGTALAPISFAKSIGTQSSKASGTSLIVTNSSTAVATGHSVVLVLAMDNATGTVSASDSVGNVYSVDADVNNTDGVRTVVLAAHNIVAIPVGGTITVSHPSVVARAVTAAEFAGLANSSVLDRSSSATGTGLSPASGSTATTSQADELLIGAIGIEGPTGDTYAAGALYSALTDAGTTGGSAATNITVHAEYRIVSATGAYSAGGTIVSTSRDWACPGRRVR